MSRLRIAVMGAGHLGRIHTRLLRGRDDIELVAVVDPVAAARDAIATEFSIRAVADHRALEGEIDAAIVATPTQWHFEVARDLLQQGIHTLIEKPITTTVAEADALIGLARRRGLVLQVGHVERFNPALVAARAQLGSIRAIEAVRASGYSFRSTDIGVILDLMIHDLDIVLSLTGSEVVSVAADALTVIGPCEDIAHARLQMANGCVANLTASRVSCLPQRTLQLYGDEAFAILDLTAGTARLMRPNDALAAGDFQVDQLTIAQKNELKERFFQDVLPLENVAVEKRNAIQDEQADFLRAIRTGGQPMVTGEDGRRALAAAHQLLTWLTNATAAEGQSHDSRNSLRINQAAHPLHAPHFSHAGVFQRRRAG